MFGEPSGRSSHEERLLRFAVLRGGRRRAQHQRVSRSGGRRQARAVGAAAGDLPATTRKGRFTSTTCSNVGGGLAEAGAQPRGARRAARRDAGRSATRHRTRAPVYRRVHPAAGAGPAVNAAVRSRDRRRRAAQPLLRRCGAPPPRWLARLLLLPWLAFAQLQTATQPIAQGDALQVPPFPPACEEAGVPEDPAFRGRRG